VLNEIGAANVPQILVLNQIDRMGMAPGVDLDEYGNIRTVRVSAREGTGIEDLRQALLQHQQYLKKLSTEESAYV